MDDIQLIHSHLVHLARLALSGRQRDVVLLIRRLIQKTKGTNPKLSKELADILAIGSTVASPIREAKAAEIPVDHDSRLQLARLEHPVMLGLTPVWTDDLKRSLDLVVEERRREQNLFNEGLHPTKSLLFTGPPGVGKTLAARWLAEKLKLPLVVLDLSAVMSSFLGRTGSNLRHVLDYAKEFQCVLLLDEFDAIAKRRDDMGEIGELKRLVTVLLQEIDDFPSTSLLVAATNHAELLDPAVWRRFELVLQFPLPSVHQVKEAVLEFLGPSGLELLPEILEFAAAAFGNHNFSEIERAIRLAKRDTVISGENINVTLTKEIGRRSASLSKSERTAMVGLLKKSGLSQRKINELTGISRDTLRRMTKGVAHG